MLLLDIQEMSDMYWIPKKKLVHNAFSHYFSTCVLFWGADHKYLQWWIWTIQSLVVCSNEISTFFFWYKIPIIFPSWTQTYTISHHIECKTCTWTLIEVGDVLGRGKLTFPGGPRNTKDWILSATLFRMFLHILFK